jgi:hypothetical protein
LPATEDECIPASPVQSESPVTKRKMTIVPEIGLIEGGEALDSDKRTGSVMTEVCDGVTILVSVSKGAARTRHRFYVGRPNL